MIIWYAKRQRNKRFVLQDFRKPLLAGILTLLCIGCLAQAGLLHILKTVRRPPVSAELLGLLGRWWGNPRLVARRCAATAHLLAARLRWRCRGSVWIKRLRVSMWLVRGICGRRRGHDDQIEGRGGGCGLVVGSLKEEAAVAAGARAITGLMPPSPRNAIPVWERGLARMRMRMRFGSE